MWTIEYEYIMDWLDEQDRGTVASVFAALEVLQREGPNLGRPLVDSINGSKLKNMKELRPASPGDSEVRILFAFDPLRQAVMLLAGDKSKGKKLWFEMVGLVQKCDTSCRESVRTAFGRAR